MNLQLNVLTLILFFICLSETHAQKRVACIGDSVTKGLGISAKSSYPAQLQRVLGNDFIVENFGNSGSTLLSKGHKPYVTTDEYADALRFDPDIVVISLGLNDTDPRNWPNYNREFERDYSDLIESFRKQNKAVQVFVCNLTPIFSGHRRFLSGTRDWFQAIQNLLPGIALHNNAHFVEIHPDLESRIDLFSDYLHPEAKGAGIMAQRIAKAIKGIHQPLRIHESLGSNMVLQRDRPNTIHGIGSSRQRVEVCFGGKTYETEIDNNGDWEVQIPKMKAGGPHEIRICSQEDTVKLSNILFGDVFLAAGQSNMAFRLKQAKGAKEIINTAPQYAQIRLFKCVNRVETAPVVWDSVTLDDVNDLKFFHGEWVVPNAEEAGNFSAIAYAFAYKLAATERIPIGIVDLSVGGSPTESWISRRALENDNLLASYLHNWRTSDFIQDFCKERANLNLKGTTLKNQRHPYDPAYNYEAGITKWLNTNFKAVLWYQGESNAHNIELHNRLFKTLVHSWREIFEQELPFYFVQLSGIERPSWPEFRDSQRLLDQEIADTYMAVSLDLGDSLDVHPKDKLPIGYRLANMVRQHEYRQKVNADYPNVVRYSIAKKQLKIDFDACDYLATKEGAPLVGFELVDSRGHVHIPQSIKINRKSVFMEMPDVEIQRVQYAYTPFSRANLVNEAGVPVSTFSFKIN